MNSRPNAANEYENAMAIPGNARTALKTRVSLNALVPKLALTTDTTTTATTISAGRKSEPVLQLPSFPDQ